MRSGVPSKKHDTATLIYKNTLITISVTSVYHVVLKSGTSLCIYILCLRVLVCISGSCNVNIISVIRIMISTNTLLFYSKWIHSCLSVTWLSLFCFWCYHLLFSLEFDQPIHRTTNQFWVWCFCSSLNVKRTNTA